MSRKAAFAAACIGYTAWSVDGGAGELAKCDLDWNLDIAIAPPPAAQRL